MKMWLLKEIRKVAEKEDGFTISQTDYANIRSSQQRSYTTTGTILKKTDGRGNTTITETDLAQRPVKVTDAAGNVTRTSYHPCCDAPACITDALGGVTCYSYDIRGRKTAEYGDAIRCCSDSCGSSDRN